MEKARSNCELSLIRLKNKEYWTQANDLWFVQVRNNLLPRISAGVAVQSLRGVITRTFFFFAHGGFFSSPPLHDYYWTK